MPDHATPNIDPTRLALIPPLGEGSHSSIEDGACIMEAAAFIAGEPWSDAPACACPVISAFLRAWNDGLPDDERDGLLRPLILRVIGTKATPAIEHRRSLLATDWLVREHTPAWLRLAGLTAHADTLAALPEITDMAQMPSIRGAIEAARVDAGSATAAARDATWTSATASAKDATWAAVWAAATAFAWDALNPTRLVIQQSALRLVERMIDCGREG